jgi:hypothetical protein
MKGKKLTSEHREHIAAGMRLRHELRRKNLEEQVKAKMVNLYVELEK